MPKEELTKIRMHSRNSMKKVESHIIASFMIFAGIESTDGLLCSILSLGEYSHMWTIWAFLVGRVLCH